MRANPDITDQINRLSLQIQDSPSDAALFFERGKLFWKIGRRAEAMTDFNTAISFDPQSPARAYLDMANDIMDFYNTDLYNP